MKSLKHPDGVRRITMKMEVAVDVQSLTLYALDMVSSEPDLCSCSRQHTGLRPRHCSAERAQGSITGRYCPS